ncbi:MAG: HD domain-containing protein [Calditrichaeota bacterium]|nr:MAG: HD domain-containing protein [Calditrichota bacterium]
MATIERAIEIALEAHRGQVDKAGQPYILHPLRLMLKMASETEMITAVLHDVVEDSSWTLQELRGEGFSGEVIAAVDCLTHREGESYQVYLERICRNPIAVKVKLADLEDNLDIRRLDALNRKDTERLNQYLRAYRQLQGIARGAPSE